MKVFFKISFYLISIFSLGCSDIEKDIYMFSYFKGNGEDGLHLAYSFDGLKWTALNDDN